MTSHLNIRRLFNDRPFPWVVFALGTGLLSLFGLVRIARSIANGYDLGIFDQIVRRYAHFQVPYATLKGDEFNIFGDHFHPLVALWAPLYWIWDDPHLLIVLQTIVVAATVFPLWRFVRRRWSGSVAKIFAACIIAGWPIVALAAFDVHEIAFAVPLLAWTIDGLDRRHTPTVAIACFLLSLVREDMGAVVAMAGVVWLVSPWRRRRTRPDWVIGASLIIAGLAAFIIITGMVIPHSSATGYQYWDYGAFGATADAQIPPDTCVVASNRYADSFVRTNRVTVPGVGQHRQDFHILDMSLPPTSVGPLNWTAQQAYDDAISQGFTKWRSDGNVVILQSPNYQGPDPVACGPDAR